MEKGKKGLPPAHGICYALHVTGKLSTATPHSMLPKLLRIAELAQSRTQDSIQVHMSTKVHAKESKIETNT